jgi:ribonuclease-3
MQALGYTFQNQKLQEQAFTHPSLRKQQSNQRLEFLGDAVLGLIVAEMLYQRYPEEQEGDLARRHAALVCGESLVKIAEQVGLGESLRMAESEVQSGGRTTASNLEDVCEALIGAIYLDGGIEAARAWVVSHWAAHMESLQVPPKDSKTGLQEWAQGRGLGLPVYTVMQSTGPAHAPEFTIRVEVAGVGYREASAGNKRAAEQAAAKALLDSL